MAMVRPDAIGNSLPEDTMVTHAFSGGPGRSIATAYARAATRSDAPPTAPYPVQRELTRSGARAIGAGSWQNLRLHDAICRGIAGCPGARPSRVSSNNGRVGDSDLMRQA